MPPAPDGPGAAYRALERRFRRLSLIGEALRLLEWDRAVMMPPGGAESRAEQVTELTLVRHGLITDPALAALLDEAEAQPARLDPWQRANLAAMRRKWRHANAVPADLTSQLRAGNSFRFSD